MISQSISDLVEYGLRQGMIKESDAIYARNRIMEYLRLDSYDECDSENRNLEDILRELLDYAKEQGIIDTGVVAEDLFDSKLMNCLMPRPSEVVERFQSLYKQSPDSATDYFFKLSQDSDYIRRYRICKDMKWITETEYGPLDITINLSKPEKDPKAIAAAKSAPQSGYPKCLLCKENVGYAGRMNHPGRANHRIIPMTIAGSDWYMQYSPYVYYNEHCIVFNGMHTPMKIERATFAKLFDFIKLFPNYILGSNADLPIVGGSILSHDHFQGGRYEFAMAKAPIEIPVHISGYEDVDAGIVKWPMSVIRISSDDADRLIDLGDKILRSWRSYTDEAAYIYSETDGELHNTITPIARKRGDKFELDLVLRNNITTPERPDGLYHPRQELHHIKKENIGLIEVMGLAILPSRLKTELAKLSEYLLAGKDVSGDADIDKHAAWAHELNEKYKTWDKTTIDDILKLEVGIVFKKVLEDAGVYKCDAKGREAFERFIDSIK